MAAAGVQTTIRNVLVSVFVIAELVGAGGCYLLLRRQAMQEAEQQSRLLLASAKALREYTSARILPELQGHPDQRFHEVTVPSFAAQTVLGSLKAGERTYTYRESALDPTNPRDRATPFEVDLVRRFQQNAGLTRVSGLTTLGAGQRAFYVAEPFRISDRRCLTCHSTPAAAPPLLLAKYGASNGFNWRLGDTVGVQLLTVPVASRFRTTLELAALLSAGLLATLLAAYFALSQALDKAVVGPLRELAAAADKASRTGADEPELPARGASEVADLSAAIQRLRTSLRQALAKLSDGTGGNP